MLTDSGSAYDLVDSIDSSMDSPKEIKTVLGTMTFGNGTDETVASQMLQTFAEYGHSELDTAIMYAAGQTEKILGSLNASSRFSIASKANPKFDIETKQTTVVGHASLSYDKIRIQFEESITSLKVDSIDLYYLHMPDHDTPIEESLRAIHSLYEEGKIKRFGLSNYAAWQVMEIYHICDKNDWIKPSVYQGMYNAITREVERELFPCLRRLNISFYAYNPLCGGMLTGRYNEGDQPTQGRFAGESFWGNVYRSRYMQPPQFAALKLISQACEENNITIADAAIRWLYHHSALSRFSRDAVILGASSLEHLQSNLDSAKNGPLPSAVTSAIEHAWVSCRAVCPSYFR